VTAPDENSPTPTRLGVFETEPTDAELADEFSEYDRATLTVAEVPWFGDDADTCFRCQRPATTTTIDGDPVCDSCIETLNDETQGRDDRTHGLDDFSN